MERAEQQPARSTTATFSASRLFAAVYPEAVRLAGLIAWPTWRHFAAGDADQQRQRRHRRGDRCPGCHRPRSSTTEVGRRLDRPHHPGDGGDAVAHWMMFDCWRSPSRPDRTFPDSLHHGAIQPPKVSANSQDRHRRSAQWFARTRRGGGAILHHRHIRPVLIREWSPKMDGIAGTIWASHRVPRRALRSRSATAPAEYVAAVGCPRRRGVEAASGGPGEG